MTLSFRHLAGRVAVAVVSMACIQPAWSSTCAGLGAAAPYNALVFGDFIAQSSDVEGRLAAAGKVSINHYSLADKLDAASAGVSVVVGGDFVFPNGRIYHGNSLVGGSAAGVGASVRNGLAPGQTITDRVNPLPVDFPAAQSSLQALSNGLAALPANGSYQSQWGGLTLNGQAGAALQVFDLPGQLVLDAHTFNVQNIPANATVVFNIRGGSAGLTDMSLESLAAIRHRVLFNFPEATTLTLRGISVEGSVLAPKANIPQPQGVLKGQLVAKSWNGIMQLNHEPFSGCLPASVANQPPRIVSTPGRIAVARRPYRYDVDAVDPDGDVLQYALPSAPAAVAIDADGGLVQWTPTSADLGVHPMKAKATDPHGASDQQSWDVRVLERFCAIYPIGLPQSVLAPLAPGALVDHLPRGTGAGNFSWLTWAGSPSAPTLAASLLPPGDSWTYVNPDQPSDRFPDPSDWVQGATGSMNASEVRARLDALKTRDIIVPAWDATRGQGSNFDYRVARFVTVRVRDYQLTGQGWLSFEYKGEAACYNLAPQAYPQQLVTPEDTALPITLAGSDPDEDPLGFRVVVTPSHGSLSGDGAEWVYQPAPDFTGNDYFEFVVDDGFVDSLPARVDILVTSLNDAPLAFDQDVTTPEDVPVAIVLTGSDPDGDPLLFHVIEEPRHGVLSGIAPDLVYVPAPDFHGSDSFRFITNDAESDSAPATVSITVTPVNDAPQADPQQLVTDQDVALPIILTGSDPEGAALSFTVVAPPAHGSLSGSGSDLVYTPDAGYFGEDAFSFVAHDGELDSAPAVVAIEVVRGNRPPVITSEPPLQGRDCEEYVYQVVATDADPGDVLVFDLVTAPEGMGIDPHSGGISWTPDGSQLGSHRVEVIVTDTSGASALQSFDVVVARCNEPPQIVSTPPHAVDEGAVSIYDVDAVDPNDDPLVYSLVGGPQGMSIAPDSGLIEWTVPADWVGGNLLDNPMCLRSAGAQSSLAPAADVVIVVDESSSMSGEHAWIADVAAPLEAHLDSNGIGNGAAPNQYGLLGYEATPRPLNVGGQLLGNYRELAAATSQLRISGGTEDGWRAIQYALREYPLRANAARNIILITDEDRDNTDSSITYDSILAELLQARAALNAVVDARFRCGDGSSALGVGQGGVGYKADGRGGFITCTGAVAHSGGGTTIANYVNLALATGGAAWDLAYLREGGITAQSFTTALLHIKVQEILEQIPPMPLADAVVFDLGVGDDGIHVELGNRGVADLAGPLEIVVTVDSLEVARRPVGGLAAGERLTLTLPAALALNGGERIRAAVEGVPDEAECHVANNHLDATWVRVRASDPQGLSDGQDFSVWVRDLNEGPAIVSSPVSRAVVGGRYRYQIEALDPDTGDSLEFELVNGPVGMGIDRVTGELSFKPNPAHEGAHNVHVRARDLAGLYADQQFVLEVDRSYLPPRFTSTPVDRAIVNEQYRYAAAAEGDPSAVLGFDLFLAPEGMVVDPASGEVTWQVPADYYGKTHVVVLRVRDGLGNYDLQIYTVFGDRPNDAPRITSNPGVSATQGSTYSYNPTVADGNFREVFTRHLDVAPPGAVLASNGGVSWPAASVNSTLPATLAANNPQCFVSTHPSTGSIALRTLRTDAGITRVTQPLVGPLVDTNVDGALDAADRPTLVAVAWSATGSNVRRVIALDLESGGLLWTHTQRAPDWNVLPAMADLERTGQASVLFVDAQKYLVALDSRGDIRWVSNAPVAGTNQTLTYSAISLADLDGDGTAEILAGPSVFGSDGQLRWQFPLTNNGQGQALAIDLDGDGSLEVLYRGEARSADGNLLFTTPSQSSSVVTYALFAPVRIQGLPRPAIAISEQTSAGKRLTLMDHAGNLIWQIGSPTIAQSGPLVVGDFDGSGSDRIFLPASGQLFDGSGQLVWNLVAAGNWTARDFRGGASADIDGDGHLDLISFGNGSLQIRSGSTGALLAADTGWSDGSHYSMAPVVVDPRGDGRVRLVAGGNGGVRIYEPAIGTWRTDAQVVHQAAFAPDRIDASLRLAEVPPAGSLPPFTYSSRAPGGSTTTFLSDLRISAPYGRPETGGIRLSADVVNRGTAVSQPFAIEFFRGTTPDAGSLVGSVAGAALIPGQSVTLSLTGLLPVDLGEDEIIARIVPASDEAECEPGNNSASGQVMEWRVRDHGGLEASQRWVVGVNESLKTPRITSTAPLAGTTYLQYEYAVGAVSDHVGDALLFELTTAPAGASIQPRSGVVTWIPQWNQTGSQRFTVRVTSLNGRNVSQTWNVAVTATSEPNSPPQIISSAPGSVVLGGLYRYPVQAIDPEGHKVTFSLPTAPEGMRIDADSGLILWVPAVAPQAPALVVVRAQDDRGASTDQSFSVRVHESANQAPSISSTPATTAHPGVGYIYDVLASDPDGDELSYSLPQSPGGMSVSVGGRITWTPLSSQVGNHLVTVRVSDGRGGTATQQFTLLVREIADNRPPVIASSPGAVATVGTEYAYDVSAADPDGDALQYILPEGPEGMAIEPGTGRISWTPIESQVGVHPVRVEVSDGRGGVAVQAYSLQAIPAGSGSNNEAPAITSVPPFSAKVGQGYRYPAVAVDQDGDSLTWSVVQGPGSMHIGPASGELLWTPETVGVQPVRIRVSDGVHWVEQGWVVNVLPADTLLSASVIVSPQPALPGQAIAVTVVVEGAAGEVSVQADLDGSPVALLPNTTTLLTAPAEPGSHVLVIVVSDGAEQVEVVETFNVVDPNDQSPPTVQIHSPREGENDHLLVVTSPLPVVATVSDDNLRSWELMLVERNAPAGEAVRLASGGSNVSNAQVGVLDPTLQMNGQYALLLRAQDLSGNTAQDIVPIAIDGDMKLGHFSITFEDLSVPVSGIPVRVTRTYDTRQRHRRLDFGHGWSVDYQNVRIHETRRPGFAWEFRVYPSGPLGLIPNYCMESALGNVVSVTLADGKVEKFRAKASPECNQVLPLVDVNIVFEPMPGTHGKLEALNESAGRLIAGSISEIETGGVPLDPSLYRYTDGDGVEYEVDQNFGVRQIRDHASDTSITFGRDGIVHSRGFSVDFIRDAQGRITSVVAPDGTTLNYEYDAQGNLAAFVDAALNRTTFTYQDGHFLRDIIDPRGIRVSRNEYDDDGRLVAIIDADGNRVEYTRDIEGRIEQVKDRNGRTTVHVYNDRGDVIAETNPLNQTTFRTYDDNGNKLSETDPAGNTQRWTYDNLGNVRTETNAANETTTHVYGTFNHLISTTDHSGAVVVQNTWRNFTLPGTGIEVYPGPLVAVRDASGVSTSFGYDQFTGELTSITDGSGATTRTEYDAQGFVTAEVDALGNRTEFVNDGLGRVLEERRSRTRHDGVVEVLVTTHEYDDNGNVVATTHPDGSRVTFDYDGNDRLVEQCDGLQRCTRTTYDARGNEALIEYPDGTSEAKEYDGNGNLVKEIDRAGRVTRHVYDPLNRLVETLYPDQTPDDDSDNPRSRSVYDLAGRLVESYDENGNRTIYGYDAAGRQTSVTDELGGVTTSVYDNRGRRTSVTDAAGRTTYFVYDAVGRVVETVFPDPEVEDGDLSDNPRAFASYDAVGRKLSETDEAGRITRYAYDRAGRLVAVVLPDPATGENPPLLNGDSPHPDTLVTRYTYDESGNRISQTDARGRTTHWEYDAMGRESARILPLGQRETKRYDAAGQLVESVDFNGAVTRYEYDLAGRTTLIDYPNDADVSISYTATGQRDTVTDGLGQTRHRYDARDRLTRISYPSGRSIEYHYDAVGNKVGQLTASQAQTFGYDTLNRLVRVEDLDGTNPAQVTEYGYDAVGNRAWMTYPNGTRTEYGYDRRNRLRSLVHRAGASLLLALSYNVDASGLRTSIEDSDALGVARTTTYVYDAVKRLVQESVTARDASLNRSTQWTYDAVGNRLTQDVASPTGTVSTSYDYDANDRLLDETTTGGDAPGTTSYGYDPNGSTVLRTAPGGVTSYAYDDAKRLRQAVTASGTTTYAYDVDGIRLRQVQVNGGTATTTDYLIDPVQAYAQVVEEWLSVGLASPQLAVRYVFGDDLLSQDRAGAERWYHVDGLGSTRLLTDASGSATDHYVYEAFGSLDDAVSTTATDNLYRYTGEQYDPNLGFYYLRARYYDPAQGRFRGMDAFVGNILDPASLHKYVYAHAHPVNGRDPSGYMTLMQVGTTLNVASNLYTAGAITFNVLTGNYGAAGVMAKEIAEEVVLSKLSYLRPVAKLSDEATALFGRIWSRTVKLKLGYPRDSAVLRHNMEEILGKAPGNHQAHHIVGGAYAEGKQATQILQGQGIDVNSLMNGVFLPGCGNTGGLGAIHCGKHTQAYEQFVLGELSPLRHDKTALVNKLNEIREALLTGSLRLNKH